jgi:hypothetical protein
MPAEFEVTATYTERDATHGADGSRAYSRSLEVVVSGLDDDDPVVGQVAILSVPGVPRRGDVFACEDGTFDSGARCTEVSCRPTPEAPWRWEVTAKYSTDASSTEVIDNPLLRPSRQSWDDAEATEVAEEDRDGNAVVNSAGDAFDPPRQKQVSWSVLTVVKNQAEYDHMEMLQYKNKVNAELWFGVPPGWAKVKKISGKDNDDNGFYYWEVTYVIEIKEGGWGEQILDQGYREYNEAGDGWKYILNDTGSQVTRPALLDGFGYELAKGEDPVFLEFNFYEEIDFTDLDLP